MARVQKRADTYEYPQYRSELGAYAAAVGPVAPGIALSAGGFASTSWEDHEDDLLSNSWLPVFSTHAYALPTCGAATRRRSSRYYTARLLSGRTYQPLVSRAAQLSAVATSHGAAVRVSEANTAICGGVHKGSDTFAAALWATDVLFGMAEAGVRNVDLHTWTGAWYAPVDFVRVRGRTVGRVRPLFYAMLLFDRATPRGARLLPVGPNVPNAQLKTWATVDGAGTRRVVVVNKDARRPHKVVLRVPGAGDRARVERLAGPVGRRDARRDVRRAGLRAADARRQAARQARRGAGRPQVRRVPRAPAGGQRRAGDGAGSASSAAAGRACTTVRPPSTGTVAPVMKLASSESRWATAAATSSGRPARPIGCRWASSRVDARRHLGRLGLVLLVEARRDDRARGDGVDADPARAVLDGERPRQPLGRGLGGHVRRAARHRQARLVGGDVDDRARRPGRQEAPDRRRAADDGEREVHVDEVEQLARRTPSRSRRRGRPRRC